MAAGTSRREKAKQVSCAAVSQHTLSRNTHSLLEESVRDPMIPHLRERVERLPSVDLSDACAGDGRTEE